MKKEYRIESNDAVHAPGLLRYLLNEHRPLPEEKLRTMQTDQRRKYDATFHRCIYMLGVAFPDMPFKHIEAIAQRQAKVTEEGETLIIEFEE